MLGRNDVDERGQALNPEDVQPVVAPRPGGLGATYPTIAQSAGRRHRLFVAGLIVSHVFLLGWSATRHSPTPDEVGSLAAGIVNLRSGDFSLYRVNPPLVRMVAAAPAVLCGIDVEPSHGDTMAGRPEYGLGRDLVRRMGWRSVGLFASARWVCLSFSVIGAWVCFRWAGDLYGPAAGCLATALWCFSPTVIGHGQLCTTDVPAAALGAASVYTFWKWCRQPNWARALSAGVVLGLAELTKTTWIILFGLYPVLWLLSWAESGADLGDASRRSRLGQLLVLLTLALYVLNLGYGFEGTLRRLRDYQFISGALGEARTNEDGQLGNRFKASWLGYLPVPVPHNFLQGIDRQKWDFEREQWSYLRGQWRSQGWWYYYLYAMAIKVPIGTWLLSFLALIAALARRHVWNRWRDALFLLLPAACVLLLASSQPGLNRHLRYVLPLFPFLFIAISQVAAAAADNGRRLRVAVVALMTWSIVSSLWIYPHNLAYFNEAVGGPCRGHAHLLSSNIDWGQDLLFLRSWLDRHPEVSVKTACHNQFVDPATYGLAECDIPNGPLPGRRYSADRLLTLGPQPGRYAVNVSRIRGRSGELAYFLLFEPVARAGYSIQIFDIRFDEANEVRRRLNLPRLPVWFGEPSPSD